MMRSNRGTIDHVGFAVSLHHFRQCLKHRIEHACLHPAPVATKHAVPFAVLIGKVTPLRPRPRHPHHPLEIAPVILCRATPAPPFGRQQRPNDCPFLVRYPNPLAQHRLPKSSGETASMSHVNLCPRNLALQLRPASGVGFPCGGLVGSAPCGPGDDESRLDLPQGEAGCYPADFLD